MNLLSSIGPPVQFDEGRCAGHGRRLKLCPEVFEMTDDGWAVANPGEVPAATESTVIDAIAKCPNNHH